MSKFDLSRTIARNLGVKTSLEDFDVDVNIGTAENEVDENGAQLSPVTSSGELTPEAAEVEVTEQAQEVEETADQAEELDEDVETLESLKIVLEKSLSQGGLDTISAEMFNITLNTVLNKHGIKATDVVPSMEDFGDNRYHSTQVSMEKVGEALRSFGAGVVNVLKKIWFEVKKFMHNLVTVFKGGLEKRAKAVIEKAKAVEGATPKNTKVKIYAAKRLENKGKVAKPSVLLTEYKKFTEDFKLSSENVTKSVDEILNFVKEGKGTEIPGRIFASLNALFKGFITTKGSDEMVATKGFYFASANAEFKLKKVGDKDYVPNRGTIRYHDDKFKDSEDGYEAEVMTPADAKAIAEEVLASLPILAEFEKFFSRSNVINAISDDVVNQMDKNGEIDSAGSAVGAGLKAGMKVMAKDSRAMIMAGNTLIQFAGKLADYHSKTSKALVDYAAQSLSEYSKAKEEKK